MDKEQVKLLYASCPNAFEEWVKKNWFNAWEYAKEQILKSGSSSLGRDLYDYFDGIGIVAEPRAHMQDDFYGIIFTTRDHRGYLQGGEKVEPKEDQKWSRSRAENEMLTRCFFIREEQLTNGQN